MLFPYRDINPTKRFPLVTFFLIFTNVFVFLYGVFNPSGFAAFVHQFSMIPLEIGNGNLPDSALVDPYLSLFTYMYIHGGVFHLVFNMLFLWIFGNNVEDSMSRPGFFIFYSLTGIIGGLAFYLLDPSRKIDLVGASGAISGVMGAYMFLFPMVKVHALLFIIPIRLPAIAFLIVWFVMQLSGFMNGQGNVAWITHIAGFISGILLFKLFVKKD
ncbi:MAG: rhomboid family intramembrane serine protease [Spirochaetes bacterium]|jgi:membrane associated rhomboid family serine protease|nr:rhomboid family intramembrane serine protease [Spirochaetota bacterium]